MTDIKDEAIVFQCDYVDRAVGTMPKDNKETAFLPNFTDIHITNVVCRGTKTGIKATGTAGMVHGIDVSNSTFFYTRPTRPLMQHATSNSTT